MASTDSWQSRYHQLLEQAGVCCESLAEQARPPEGNGAGVSLADCLERPALLDAVIRKHAGASADFRERRTHASVLHQSLVLSIIAPLTTRLLLEGESHVPGAEQIRLEESGGEILWRFRALRPATGTGSFIDAMAGQANAWYPRFREEFGVSPGAYWSSVGLALCAPFSALYDKAPPATLCREASEWLEQFDCDARKFIDWIPVEFNQHPCAIPQRRGCCLKYKLPAGVYCGTCGIYRRQRMS
jgi:hypothetical protein